MAQTNDQEFLEFVVRSIVDNPGDVQVDRRVDEMGVLLELKVNPEDMGKIIGKDGRTAKAIRTLLRVIGAQSNARINLKIVEPEGSTRSFGAHNPDAGIQPTQEDSGFGADSDMGSSNSGLGSDLDELAS